MIAWGAFQVIAGWLESAAAWLLEWIATVGSAGLLIAGIALLIYSALPLMPYRLLAAPAGILAAVVGLWLGYSAAEAYGRRAGIAEERARWEAESKAEQERQAVARSTLEIFGQQLTTSIVSTVAGLQPILNEIKAEASKEDAPVPPPPSGCPVVYRGLPPGSLLKLDALSR